MALGGELKASSSAAAAAHLVAGLVALSDLDDTVQGEHAAVGLGLEDLDVLVLRVLVVQRFLDLQ